MLPRNLRARALTRVALHEESPANSGWFSVDGQVGADKPPNEIQRVELTRTDDNRRGGRGAAN